MLGAYLFFIIKLHDTPAYFLAASPIYCTRLLAHEFC